MSHCQHCFPYTRRTLNNNIFPLFQDLCSKIIHWFFLPFLFRMSTQSEGLLQSCGDCTTISFPWDALDAPCSNIFVSSLSLLELSNSWECLCPLVCGPKILATSCNKLVNVWLFSLVGWDGTSWECTKSGWVVLHYVHSGCNASLAHEL